MSERREESGEDELEGGEEERVRGAGFGVAVGGAVEVDGSDFDGEVGDEFGDGSAAGEVGGGETGENFDD